MTKAETKGHKSEAPTVSAMREPLLGFQQMWATRQRAVSPKPMPENKITVTQGKSREFRGLHKG